MALATTDDYAAYWPVATGLVPQLVPALEAASKFMSGEAGRNLESASYTERYSGNGSAILKLRNWPITAVSSLTVGGSVWTVLTDADADTGQPAFLERGGKWLKARNGYYFQEGQGNIQATYTAGYAQGSVPADIITCCVFIAKLLLVDLDKMGTGGKTLGPEQVQLVVRKFEEYPLIGRTLGRLQAGV